MLIFMSPEAYVSSPPASPEASVKFCVLLYFYFLRPIPGPCVDIEGGRVDISPRAAGVGNGGWGRAGWTGSTASPGTRDAASHAR